VATQICLEFFTPILHPIFDENIFSNGLNITNERSFFSPGFWSAHLNSTSFLLNNSRFGTPFSGLRVWIQRQLRGCSLFWFFFRADFFLQPSSCQTWGRTECNGRVPDLECILAIVGFLFFQPFLTTCSKHGIKNGSFPTFCGIWGAYSRYPGSNAPYFSMRNLKSWKRGPIWLGRESGSQFLWCHAPCSRPNKKYLVTLFESLSLFVTFRQGSKGFTVTYFFYILFLPWAAPNLNF